MYVTKYEVDKESLSDDTHSFVRDLEQQFDAIDMQLSVLRQDGDIKVNMEVYNMNVDECQFIAGKAEQIAQDILGFNHYSVQTTSNEITFTI